CRDRGRQLRCVRAAADRVDQTRHSPARLLGCGDGRARRAARDHGAGGAERPGLCRAEGGRSQSAGQCGDGGLRNRLRPFPGLTGPTNAIIPGSGARERQYTAGIVVGLLALLFGLLAPTFTKLLLSAPKSFVAALAGLAMLRVLQTAFVTAFANNFALGALV